MAADNMTLGYGHVAAQEGAGAEADSMPEGRHAALYSGSFCGLESPGGSAYLVPAGQLSYDVCVGQADGGRGDVTDWYGYSFRSTHPLEEDRHRGQGAL